MSKFISTNQSQNITLADAIPLVRKLALIGIAVRRIVAISATGGGVAAEVLDVVDFRANGIDPETPAHLFAELDGPTANDDGGNTMPVFGNFQQLAAVSLTVKKAPSPEVAAERLLDVLNVGDFGASARERFLRIGSVQAAYAEAVRKAWDAA